MQTPRQSERNRTTTSNFDWSPHGQRYTLGNAPVEYTLHNGNKAVLRGTLLAKLAVQKSSIPRAGNGLIAMQKIKARDYITEYKGEVISEADATRRKAQAFLV